MRKHLQWHLGTITLESDFPVSKSHGHLLLCLVLSGVIFIIKPQTKNHDAQC